MKRLWIIPIVLGAAGCATRKVPPSFPSTAAVSPEAPAAPTAAAARTVTSEPPLPGEPTNGWSGLDDH